MADVRIRAFDPDDPAHVDGVATVCRALGWPSYSDPDVVQRGCAAPGVTTAVALGERGAVVGFAQVLGDGVVQGFLAQLGVLASHRRNGVASALVEAVFAASGVQRLDLVTDDEDDANDAGGFYERLPHRPKHGYRVYPGATGTQARDADHC